MVRAGTLCGRPLLTTVWRAGFCPLTRGQHLAEDDLADLVAGQLGAFEQAGDDGRAELGGGCLGKGSAELADGGPGGSDDDDVGHEVLLG